MSLLAKINSFMFVVENKKRVLNKKLLKGLILLFFLLSLVLLFIIEKKQNVTKEKMNIDINNSQGAKVQVESLKANNEQRKGINRDDTRQLSTEHRSISNTRLLGPEFISRPGSEKIPPGTVVKAILENGATDGPVKARLLESIVVMGNVAFESESILIGIAESQENRLNLRFHHLKTPGDEVFEVRSIALDFKDQTVGLAASQFNNESIKLGASIGLSFVSGLSEGLKEKTNLNGAITDSNSTKNAFLNGTEKASLEYSRDLMNEVKNKKRNLYVEKGTEILVFFD